MISQRAVNYAKVLFSMELGEKCITSTGRLLLNCSELMEVLNNPVIRKHEKASVIDALFDKEITGFLKVLCDNNMIGTFHEISDAYEILLNSYKNRMKAKLSYAVEPDQVQLEQIKFMLCDKYNVTEVVLELEKDDSLIGGLVLHVKDTEFDKSIKGALSEMQKTLMKR